MTKPNAPVLIVEDSAEDYEATVRALRKVNPQLSLVRCVDGDDALDWLYGRGPYGDRQLPLLILLDLNLPGTDGREVLATLKADLQLALIPVVILTTSSNPRDVTDCYRSGANSYIIKPVNLNLFYETIACLVRFWLEISVLPVTNNLNRQ
jgi:CheY-like chemotaxis protein